MLGNTVDLVDNLDLSDLVEFETREPLIQHRYDRSAVPFVPRQRRNAVEFGPRKA
ncbi:MAG TPA: hypothetical protein VKE94_22010 [Gemmataceae bacterium]|nr:hypothetical protein [Gemmataceae bacterium]